MVSEANLAGESIRPLRRVEYERLAALGAFGDEKLELLRGVLVRITPHGVPHAGVIHRLNKILIGAVGDRADVRVQLPLAVSDDSEPEPDIAVVSTGGDPFVAHPASALLVIEIADSSLAKDRTIKSELYAEANATEYWIVDVKNELVEVYRDPSRGRYSTMTTHGRDATLELVSLPGVALDLSSFLPPKKD